jgi:hypothetical protein
MAKAKESIKNLRNIAHASGYAHWFDYLYDYVLNGHDVHNFVDKMSNKDMLEVIDCAVSVMCAEECELDKEIVRKKIYLPTFCSLGNRLL